MKMHCLAEALELAEEPVTGRLGVSGLADEVIRAEMAYATTREMMCHAAESAVAMIGDWTLPVKPDMRPVPRPARAECRGHRPQPDYPRPFPAAGAAGLPSYANSDRRRRPWGTRVPARPRPLATMTPNRKPPTWAKNATPPPLALAETRPKLASTSW